MLLLLHNILSNLLVILIRFNVLYLIIDDIIIDVSVLVLIKCSTLELLHVHIIIFAFISFI